jgi:hypothetical protein
MLVALLPLHHRQPALAAEPDVAAARQALAAHYSQQLGELAQWASDLNLAEAAEQTRKWLQPHSPRVRQVFIPPASAGILRPPDDAGPQLRQWHERFAHLRQAQAKALFDLAQQAVKAGQLSIAFELLGETLREDPDHEPARKILGQQQHAGQWRTPYEIQRLKQGDVWHPCFGWLPVEHVPRYERGERFYKSNWISAQRDAELHGSIDTAWKIETEHYLVTTNVSLEAGVELAARLERLHFVWRQLFPSYYGVKSQWTRLFAGGPAPSSRKRHSVMFFRTADEYRQALRSELPPDVITTGVYIGRLNTAYFHALPDGDHSTLYHEAVHQLFSEGRAVAQNIGERSNFWVIEGVACYMESLLDTPQGMLVGGLDAPRIQDARYYALKDDFYVPLAELTQMGMAPLQRHPRIGRIYAQSASLVDFLMHHDGGRHRDALGELLAAVYTGRDRPGTLAAVTGISTPRLDALHREHLQIGDDDLRDLPHAAQLTYLTLGGTRVTDAGLAHLKELPRVQWIDLHQTRVTDGGMAHLAKLASLRQLDLTGTRVTDAGLEHLLELSELRVLMVGATPITDAGLKHIGRMTQLRKLELWNTAITDAGLTSLKGLRQLRELDLTGTRLTDAGLATLRELTMLETLTLHRTAVTAAGLGALRQALPGTKIVAGE